MEELKEKIKQGEEAERKPDFLEASIHYKEALKIAKELNNSEHIQILKNKVVATSKQIEFNHLTVEQKIPNKVVEEAVNSIIRSGDDLDQTLLRIALHPYLRPRIEQTREQAKKSMPVSFHIVGITTYAEDGHIVSGGENPETVWLSKMYRIEQDLISNLYLSNIFKKIREEKGFNKKSVSDYIRNKNIFPKETFQILDRGVERYFEGDYISALHILIPQFERAFFILSKGRD